MERRGSSICHGDTPTIPSVPFCLSTNKVGSQSSTRNLFKGHHCTVDRYTRGSGSWPSWHPAAGAPGQLPAVPRRATPPESGRPPALGPVLQLPLLQARRQEECEGQSAWRRAQACHAASHLRPAKCWGSCGGTGTEAPRQQTIVVWSKTVSVSPPTALGRPGRGGGTHRALVPGPALPPAPLGGAPVWR